MSSRTLGAKVAAPARSRASRSFPIACPPAHVLACSSRISSTPLGVEVQRIGEKPIWGKYLHPMATETVAQIAAVMREEVVGACSHDQSAHVGVCRIASEARHVRDMWIEVDAPSREAPAQVVDPSSRRLSRELLLLDKRSLCLRQQLLAPEEIQQSQLCGDASHQLVQDEKRRQADHGATGVVPARRELP